MKPVQKLRKHSKLVQAGGRVHGILGVLTRVCSLQCHLARRDVGNPS